MFFALYGHLLFDVTAICLAVLSGYLTYKWRFQDALPKTAASIDAGYFLFLSAGSITGAYLFGTLNLYFSGIDEIGRSILGALFGAICMVELYKFKKGTSGSTGYIYVIPLTVSIIVGRIGCFLSGVHDHTHGLPTDLPWGRDFGDQIARHPVQIYESFSMLVFLFLILIILKYRSGIVIQYGFYICVGFYAAQRFMWEFLKPYGDVFGPLNIFQVLCLIILVYSVFMIKRAKDDSNTA